MTRAFISYDADRHGQYKRIIKAWEATDQYFIFNDNSTDRSVNSTNISYIKSVIKSDIQRSDVFIVIAGDYISSNKWVAWECEQARKMLKEVFVIKEDPSYKIPSELNGYYNMTILEGFNKNNISRALGNPVTLYL